MGMSFKELTKIKKGEIYWESGQYGCYQFEVITDPVVEKTTDPNNKLLTFSGRPLKSGGVVDFMFNSGYMHYAPDISKNKEYAQVGDSWNS